MDERDRSPSGCGRAAPRALLLGTLGLFAACGPAPKATTTPDPTVTGVVTGVVPEHPGPGEDTGLPSSSTSYSYWGCYTYAYSGWYSWTDTSGPGHTGAPPVDSGATPVDTADAVHSGA